jgi:DNA-binding transcriptional LysR family regulator
MELRNLRYFVAVAEELHFGRAAIRLNMAQPPLSYQIKRLENELGVQLFERTKRRVSLTGAGETFLEQAKLILSQVDHATSLALLAERGLVSELRLGFVDAPMLVVLNGALSTFRCQHPSVRLSLHEMRTMEQVVALTKSNIDLGLGLLGPHLDKNIVATVLHSSRIVATLAAGHPLAQCSEIRLDELRNEPLIVFRHQREYGFYDQFVQLCDEAGFTPCILEEADRLSASLGLVAAGWGIALMIESTSRLNFPGVVFRPVTPSPPEVKIGLLSRRDETSRTVLALKEILTESSASAFCETPVAVTP